MKRLGDTGRAAVGDERIEIAARISLEQEDITHMPALVNTRMRRLLVEAVQAEEVGVPADLLFLRSDPRDDLSALREAEVMLARTGAHFRGFLYDALMRTATRLLPRPFAPKHGGTHGSGGAR